MLSLPYLCLLFLVIIIVFVVYRFDHSYYHQKCHYLCDHICCCNEYFSLLYYQCVYYYSSLDLEKPVGIRSIPHSSPYKYTEAFHHITLNHSLYMYVHHVIEILFSMWHSRIFQPCNTMKFHDKISLFIDLSS